MQEFSSTVRSTGMWQVLRLACYVNLLMSTCLKFLNGDPVVGCKDEKPAAHSYLAPHVPEHNRVPKTILLPLLCCRSSAESDSPSVDLQGKSCFA